MRNYFWSIQNNQTLL